MIVSDSIYREFCAYLRDFLQLQLVQLEAVTYIFHKAATASLFPESKSTQARLNNSPTLRTELTVKPCKKTFLPRKN